MLKDKVAIVTGGASGIGEASASLFAANGAKVVVADLSEEGAGAVAEAINEKGGIALGMRVDVRVEEDIAAMVSQTVEHFGRLDCAFNNAGVGVGTALVEDLTNEQWNLALHTNLTAVWWCMKHQIVQFKAQGGGGAIVNTASAQGLIGRSNGAAYVASKHGVVGLTKAAALDHVANNIRINAVCPGLVWTPMAAHFVSTLDDPDMPLKRTPARRWAQPEEIAQTTMWLCSGLVPFLTGVCLPVDGGMTAS